MEFSKAREREATSDKVIFCELVAPVPARAPDADTAGVIID
ncbi:hypothetical protein HRUBRA_01255 [Pseudohaliea rubra DSM 19751]|uniref:Uncharacterized protein n=1 Tax=Pseudohaliea rubra DSM 19751 TaxID=1265313 RepID=A0A095VS24_9GAMM|nr:hypothetical protein HRUBRA_01255 [Pseudohaliea rubra DSM 19751]